MMLRRGIGATTVALLAVTLLLAMTVAARAAPFAAVVMDMRTGEILHARNHDTRLHPASLTKMMTLYIAFEAIQNGEITLDTPVRVSANAAGQPCSCLGLRAGQTIALRYLIRAAALRSGNDAATAIGEAISGSEAAFIDRMNRTARAIGMNDTTFRNAHGLTAQGHLSTARDMTTLGRQLYFDFPQYFNLFSRLSADAGIATVPNTNRAFLNSYQGADGIKTGFTRAAGFNLTASARRGDRRIIVTMFGGTSVPDRTRRVSELMDMGFARAPATATVRRPPPPNYGTRPPGGVALAAAPAAPATTAAAPRSLDTAVRRSPIPQTRPVPVREERLAALEASVAAALAEAAGQPPAVPPADTPARAAIVAPAAAPARRDEALASAMAEALSAPDEPLPFAVASSSGMALADPADDGAGPAVTEPQPRPATLQETAGGADLQSIAAAALQTAPGPSGAATGGLPFATQRAPLEQDRTAPPDTALHAPEPRPDASGPQATLPPSDASVPDAPGPMPFQVADPSDPVTEPPAARAMAVAPQPDPSEFVVLTFSSSGAEAAPRLAQLAAEGRAEPVAPSPALERQVAAEGDLVLTQVSTSSPRLWGISLGRFGTRDAAERALMRAALAELSSFDAGLRRVQSGQSGFEATFVGLTEVEARIACDRLQVRARDCTTIAP
ncbi:MAG: serine hydrolase [Alkalilacustris sp.]